MTRYDIVQHPDTRRWWVVAVGVNDMGTNRAVGFDFTTREAARWVCRHYNKRNR